MTHWKNRILYGDLSKAYRDGSLTSAQVAARLVTRLETNIVPHYADDQDLCDIIAQFDDLAHDLTTTADAFDDVLENLYDWADEDHRLWIDPTRPRQEETTE